MKMELNISGFVVLIEAEGPVSVKVIEVAPASIPAADSAPESAGNDELFSKLVDLRKQLAAESKSPPYVIFHDKTLREMAQKLPCDLQSLGSLTGVGQSKLEKYGEQFLSVINQ